METKKQKKKSVSMFRVIAFILFIGVIGGTGYFTYTNIQTEKQHQKLRTSIENTQKTIQKLDESQDRPSHFLAANILEEESKKRILWSTIVPYVLQLETNVMAFNDFNIDPERNITVKGSTRSMRNVPDIIRQIEENVELEAPFVSSISSSIKEDQALPVSFSLTLRSL